MNKRLLSMLLSLCIVVTMLPVTAMGVEVDTTIGGSGEIISFAPIIETEKSVSLGISIEDLELLETVTAVVRTAVTLQEDSVQDSGSLETATATTATESEWEENIVEIPVTWTSQPEYDMDTKGEYVFRPVIEDYTVSSVLPEIRVTVGELLPTAVALGLVSPLADDTYNIWVGGVQVTDVNKDNISGTDISGNISYDPDTSTLTLNGTTITAVYEKTIKKNISGKLYDEEHQYGIYADITDLKIVVTGNNTINCPDADTKHSYGIYARGALEITGNGSLSANSGKGIVSYGIYSDGELTIKSGTITGISNAIYTSLGIYGSKINISGGDVSANSTGGSAHAMVANSYNITGGKITVTGNNGLSANFDYNPINISGGEVNANVSNNAISGVLNFQGGTVIATGEKALKGTLNLIKGIATAGTNKDGSNAGPYDADNLPNYKYLKIEPVPDTTVTNFDLTSKLTAPATGGRPDITITDDQYTGTIAWSDNPTIFIGSRAYIATVTLTGKDGYIFSGVAENAFSYDGATSVMNSIGSDKIMTVTIVFPQTMARTLQEIIITRPPNKTAYYYGEIFDKTGMIVKASYDDGTIDENFTNYTVDKTGHLTLSDNLITLTANGTTIKTTQAITVIKKTLATADLVFDLTAVDYDSTEKPVTVMAAHDKTLGAITVKYNGITTVPTNAGNYLIRVDIAESTEYNAATDLSLGNYTINKIDYRGNSTLSENILVDGKIGASITLPDIPEGAKCGTPIAGGTIMMTDMSISGNKLIYTAPKSTTGQSGTMTIPVTDATNYKDYNIVVTITYTAKTPQMISYATTTITKIYGDAKFVNPLTQDEINGTITYASDDNAVATVNPSTGEVTIVSVGDGSATITATAMETDTHAQATASYIVTVSKKALTLKADDKNMIQGNELPNFTFTAIGLVNGDNVIAPPTISTTTNGTTVGIFDITPLGGVVENAASYNIIYTKGTLTVAGGSGGSESSSDDSGSSDTSSSNDSSPVIVTPPAADKPNDPTQGEIKVHGTADGKDNITVKITNKTVTDAFDKAFADAKKNGNEKNGITVVLRVDTGSKTGSNVTVNLPKTVQDTIIAKKIVNTIVVVDNPDIRIGMDLATVQEINKQAKSDVNVTATRRDSSKLTGEAKNAIGERPVFDLKVNYGSGQQVQSFGAGNVLVTIPYTLGPNEMAENVQAVYVDSNGKVHWLVNSVYDSMEKVLRFSTNHFSTYGVGYKEDAPVFTDIASHWAKEDIEFVISNGLFSGTSATTFSPNTAMTRGMFVTVLGRLADADVSSYNKSSFSDVDSDAYYMGYIEWASKNNIVNGTANGNFAPDQGITREQMAVIIRNYAKIMDIKLTQAYGEDAFADSAKISTYAKDAVKQMQMAGVISGKNSNLFDPQGKATRAEVAALLRRFVELVSSSDTM